MWRYETFFKSQSIIPPPVWIRPWSQADTPDQTSLQSTSQASSIARLAGDTVCLRPPVIPHWCFARLKQSEDPPKHHQLDHLGSGGRAKAGFVHVLLAQSCTDDHSPCLYNACFWLCCCVHPQHVKAGVLEEVHDQLSGLLDKAIKESVESFSQHCSTSVDDKGPKNASRWGLTVWQSGCSMMTSIKTILLNHGVVSIVNLILVLCRMHKPGEGKVFIARQSLLE